nr:hypothetical protein [Anabaena sp. CS-542/02]
MVSMEGRANPSVKLPNLAPNPPICLPNSLICRAFSFCRRSVSWNLRSVSFWAWSNSPNSCQTSTDFSF